MGPGAPRPGLGLRASAALAASAAAVLLVTGVSAAAPERTAVLPQRGVLVPGKSLGGIALGMTKPQVRRVWGARFGRCRSCADETWYFNYLPFEPEGAGVAFRRGRVIRVFTVWQPDGWRTTEAVALGAPESDVTDTYGALPRRRCIRYTALLMRSERVQTAFYVHDGELWGFGLTRPAASPCV